MLDGLTKLFKEIKEKDKIADLSVEYQKFAEWLRIEYVLKPICPAHDAHVQAGSPQPSTTYSLPRITLQNYWLKRSASTP